MMRNGILLSLAVLALAAATPFDVFHFGLAKSVPVANSTVESPEQLQLWFTQVPQDNSVRIRLLDGAGEPLGVGDATRNEEDDKLFEVEIGHTLAAGSYTVAWRGIGDDGHVVTGDFAFSVTAH